MKTSAFRLAARFVAIALALLLFAPATGRAAQQYQGLCSYVKIEILQELTLERIGFLATLEVTNNEGDASITNFSAALTFAKPGDNGTMEDASALFFVQPPKLRGITDIDGAGIIAPGQTARVEWFIIPKLSAGGTTPEGLRYEVGASLAGSIYGQVIAPEIFAVLPDTITVKPDPELEIAYFQPRDVDGDNPFTPDIVETPIPFTLGVLVKNVGYGEARKVKIASEQPRIVENLQGLLVVPKLLGARVDDQPADDTSLTVDLGDIPPGRCRKGSWDMITTLSGEFTEFKASYTHAPELGGEETSLIRSIDAFFMVHEVMNDQPGRDNLKDFLAETLGGEELIPDTLYESDCNTLPVNRLNSVERLSYSGGQAVVRAAADISGWVFMRLDDPGQAKYQIESVVRSDGKVLNPNNYWTHIRYRKTDNAKLTWLNIFDFVTLGEYRYTVTYEAAGADSAPPTTTLRFSGAHQEVDTVHYVVPETEIFFTVEDASPVGTWYRLDGAADFQPAYPFTITAAGSHTLEYYSEDAAGNAEAVQAAIIEVNAGYPEIVDLRADTGEFFIVGESVSVRPIDTTLSFGGGNLAAGASGRLEIYRGIAARPTVDGVPSSPSAATDAHLTVGGELVDFYRYQVNGGAWSEEFATEVAIDLAGLANGPVILRVHGRHRDGVYPPEEEALEVSWVVNTGASALALTGLGPVPSSSPAATMHINSAEWYCYRLDGNYYRPNQNAAEPVLLSRLSDGPHTLEVTGRATSGSSCPGNVAGEEILEWTVDRSYGHDLPAADLVYQRQIAPVTGEVLTISWDGRYDNGAAAAPGWYTMKIVITDGLGLVSEAILPVRVGDMLPDAGVLSEAGNAGQLEAHGFGARVVWQDQRHGDWDIYARNLLDPQSVDFRVTANTMNQQRPRTDGLYVVWEDQQPDGGWDIKGGILDGSGGEFAVTATPETEERKPYVHYPWIVYQARPMADPAAPWQLMAYNMLTAATTAVDPTTQNQLDPVVHQQRVVWQDFRDPGYGEIYMKDLRDGTVSRITASTHGQYHPVIFGQWIVWADNRDTQFDLYGYNLKRGVEVRLTDTPEDEGRPNINGPWVVYEEDSAGEGEINLRLLHLGNLASVQLTNLPGAKEKPALASGRLLWTDRSEGPGRLLAGSLPDLQAVYDNRNTVAVTPGVAARAGDAFTLLKLWNRQAAVTELSGFPEILPRPVAETATWSGNGPVGVNFDLRDGGFVWVRFHNTRILDLGDKSCGLLDPAVGVNVFSYSCFPDGYSAYGLIRELGPANVKAVRLLEAETGNWRVAVVENGAVVGEDFAIPATAVLLLDVNTSIGPWRPGEGP